VIWSTAALAADDVIRVAVMEFTGRSGKVTDQEAGAVRDFLARYLTNSRTITVVERDRLPKIVAKAGTGAEIARPADPQYIILGSVSDIFEKTSASAMAVPTSGKEEFTMSTVVDEATATVDIRILDVATGDVVLVFSADGTSNESSTMFIMRDVKFTEKTSPDRSEIRVRAIEEAAARLGNRILEELGGEYANVLSVDDKSVRISRGAKFGVQKGDIYLIYVEGPEILDAHGESLRMRERLPLAAVKVTDVQDDFSDCAIVDSGGKASNIRRGDRMEPISAKEIKGYIGRSAFLDERPKHSE
jgi:curli biogenesis system outer membrane secretion channel CsgG